MQAVDTRFWAKVDDTGNCWLWTAFRLVGGYGQFWDGRRVVRAHRYAYESLVGPIAAGLQLDHLCRNPSCVNPAHLEPVTPKANTLRGFSGAAMNARKTHCIHGHPFAGDNLTLVRRGRECRECHRTYAREAYRRKRAVG